MRRRYTVSQIVATVYCEQQVVFDRQFGKVRSADVARKAARGTFEHRRAEAATLIGWWHSDWPAINDIARAAAKRLRQAAKTFHRAAGTPVSSATEPGQATHLRT